MSKQTIVIYHRSDYDGIFCREISRRFFEDRAIYIGWEYGDPVPEVHPSQDIYMLDISIDALMNYRNLTWINHHKSAIEKYAPILTGPGPAGYYIDGVAACRLAWQYFNNEYSPLNPHCHPCNYALPVKQDFIDRKVQEPLAVRLAGEYDVWDHRDKQEDVAFQFGLDSQEALNWERLLHTCTESICDYDEVRDIIEDGKISMRCYAKRDAEVMRDRSFRVNFEEINFLALNTPRCNSNTFKILDRQETGHDALMAFYWGGKDWSVSMYHAAHRKDLDLSRIAARYGGGGHRGACGFRVDKLPFISC
jgi:oligoribonuclease NrnB/cAMP/cGMP phosphodiesterase (DHH superfamily)